MLPYLRLTKSHPTMVNKHGKRSLIFSADKKERVSSAALMKVSARKTLKVARFLVSSRMN